jgi:hypothetical protein
MRPDGGGELRLVSGWRLLGRNFLTRYNRPMLRRLLGLVALTCALTGCIEFERQTMVYEHDARADTLRIHQTYHGLHGADDVTRLSDQERAQLAAVMEGQRTFFFANWIFELNVPLLRESLAGLGTPVSDSLKEAERRATTNLLALLVANARVENGKFFLNEKGQPCGTQRVTLRNVSQVVEAGNAVIRRHWEVALKDKATAEERELINASLARPEPFLTLKGQQLRLRVPFPRAEFDKLGEEEPKLREFISEFIRQGGLISHERGELHVRFGRLDVPRESVTLPMSAAKDYQPNAIDHVRATFGFAKEFSPEKERESFFRAAAPGR